MYKRERERERESKGKGGLEEKGAVQTVCIIAAERERERETASKQASKAFRFPVVFLLHSEKERAQSK